jgi:tRNA(Ile)-lysidine synthase
LRHQVLPRLQARWPGLNRTLARSAAHCAEAQQILDEVAAELFAAAAGNRPYRLSVPQLRALPPHRQRLLLRHWLRLSQLPVPDTNRLNRLVSEVAAARDDAAPRVAWPGAEVRRFQGLLYAMPLLPPAPGDLVLPWPAERASVALPAGLGRLVRGADGVLALPAAVGEAPLTVRFGGAGVTATPAGRRGRRSFKRLCQEWGVPPWLRERVPLLYAGDRLVAVGDYGACEPFAPGPGAACLSLRWERPAYLR